MNVIRGSLVTLIDEIIKTQQQVSMWKLDCYFLRDPFSLNISKSWIKKGDICMVIDQDDTCILILTPRGNTGWIAKEKMEIVKC
jgi:hypothetical protein